MEALVGIFFSLSFAFSLFCFRRCWKYGVSRCIFSFQAFSLSIKRYKTKQKHSQSVEVMCTLTFPVKQLIGEAQASQTDAFPSTPWPQ